MPLFWRLFLPNAAVLGTASALLVVAPPNGRPPAIVAGFVVLLTMNLTLMRHAFGPLNHLAELASRVDPLRPGQRLAVEGPSSEVQVLTRSINAMLERLETERRDSARRALTAEQEQRRRIARDLHDELGQALTGMRLQVAQMQPAQDDGGRVQLDELRQQLDDALEALRRITREIRPEALDDLGLAVALEALCAQVEQRSAVRVRLSVPPELNDLSSEGELVLYRVAQESLTNVLRHSGATEAELRLSIDSECVTLQVSDDGHGADVEALEPSGGIRGMRERALLIGGRLAIEHAESGGLLVRLTVPTESA